MQQWQFINNFNQLNMFRAVPAGIISPVLYTTCCKYSLGLLKMGETIARNMLSWLKLLINCHCCIWLGVYIIKIKSLIWAGHFLSEKLCILMQKYLQTVRLHLLTGRQSIPPLSSPIAISSTEMLVWRFILFLRTRGVIRHRKKKMNYIYIYIWQIY